MNTSAEELMPYGNHAIMSNMFWLLKSWIKLIFLKKHEFSWVWSFCCLSLSFIDSLHGLFLTTFLFHFFVFLWSFGQQHANAELFVLSPDSDLCTQAASVFFAFWPPQSYSVNCTQLFYDLSFWPSYFALVSLHPDLGYVLYLFKKNKIKYPRRTHLASPCHPSPPQTTLSAFSCCTLDVAGSVLYFPQFQFCNSNQQEKKLSNLDWINNK